MSKDIFKAFGIPDMPKLVQDALGGNAAVLPAIFHKVTAGARVSITDGTQPTEVDTACRGFLDFQNDEFSEGTLVRNGRKVIVLLGNSLGGAVPEPGDRITIEGIKYHIPNDGEVDRDPASVTYTCEVRKI